MAIGQAEFELMRLNPTVKYSTYHGNNLSYSDIVKPTKINLHLLSIDEAEIFIAHYLAKMNDDGRQKFLFISGIGRHSGTLVPCPKTPNKWICPMSAFVQRYFMRPHMAQRYTCNVQKKPNGTDNDGAYNIKAI